jgi:hypothetical protein
MPVVMVIHLSAMMTVIHYPLSYRSLIKRLVPSGDLPYNEMPLNNFFLVILFFT